MNHYISGIIKIMILEASAALLLLDRVLLERFIKPRKIAFAVLAGLMVFAWTQYGVLRGNFTLVHYWEQFHFYLGAKYQKEVGWFDLYPAVILADRDPGSTGILGNVTQIRDVSTFELVSVDEALRDGARIRGQFSDAQWQSFKDDWRYFTSRGGDWGRLLQDHGNSNSPAWAVFAHPIAKLFSLSPSTQTMLGWLDMVLMLVMWTFIYRTFGIRTASIGLLLWATAPNSFEFLAGSFLRWDWLFALGMACCFMQREQWATAGAFFGYAVASKLFPLFFGVALLAWVVMRHFKERKLPKPYWRFGVATIASGLTWVLVAAAMFGTFDVWRQYAKRIEVAEREKFYAIQYSLKTVYLQFAESTPAELSQRLFFPAELKQARADVEIANHRFGFLLVKLLFAALVGVLLWRAPNAVSAFTLGPLLVFTFLTVNMYYWNMLGLLAMGLAMRKERPPLGLLLGLYAIFCVFFLYQHTNNGYFEGYLVALLLTGLVIGVALAEWTQVRPRAKPA